jgi:hypothetical protein
MHCWALGGDAGAALRGAAARAGGLLPLGERVLRVSRLHQDVWGDLTSHTEAAWVRRAVDGERPAARPALQPRHLLRGDDEATRDDEVDHSTAVSRKRGRTSPAHLLIRSRCSGSSASIAPSKFLAPAATAARTCSSTSPGVPEKTKRRRR